MNYPQEVIKPYNEEGKKTEQVEHMFNQIAPKYDQLNHTLSLGIDRYWRKKAIKQLKPHQPKRIMDVATGTGDFALLAVKKLKCKEMVGIDISENMIEIGKKKAQEQGLSDYITFLKEDCTQLSFQDNQFDAVTSAFGIRNFENLDKGLAEMHRVLKKGGKLVILELTTPTFKPVRWGYTIYSKHFIPFIGKVLSKDNSAYTYLPNSIKAFPQGQVMKQVMIKAGFNEVKFKSLTFGICTLYTATK
ncbi:MAG: bifunctional demethylmenaquinone methyltransferase/2-methoxy-6-polyprenyl-1,4-benzoquinol methylase UbiE [Bacteroides sp.]|nr:bifunctional demethylmenaquinone methyltransferase/2-methoxy-6-polyprenyl-1,4-benzoquinol methylase UbiE [Bacteroides sp.]